MRFTLMVTIGMAGLVGTTSTASASGLCLPVRATGVGVATGPTTTEATISVAGVVVGTTAAEFIPVSLEGDVLTFTGDIVFTARFGVGTLTTTVDGTFNLASGVFDAAGPVTASTGRLAGTTGTLRLQGVQDPVGNFTETVTGRLCAGRRSGALVTLFDG